MSRSDNAPTWTNIVKTTKEITNSTNSGERKFTSHPEDGYSVLINSVFSHVISHGLTSQNSHFGLETRHLRRSMAMIRQSDIQNIHLFKSELYEHNLGICFVNTIESHP